MDVSKFQRQIQTFSRSHGILILVEMDTCLSCPFGIFTQKDKLLKKFFFWDKYNTINVYCK